MMKFLANPYTRIAIGSAVSIYLTPTIINHFVTPEITEKDGRHNELVAAGVSGAMVAAVWVVMGAAFGKAVAV